MSDHEERPAVDCIIEVYVAGKWREYCSGRIPAADLDREGGPAEVLGRYRVGDFAVQQPMRLLCLAPEVIAELPGS